MSSYCALKCSNDTRTGYPLCEGYCDQEMECGIIHNVIHCDVSFRNVMVSGGGSFMISCFPNSAVRNPNKTKHGKPWGNDKIKGGASFYDTDCESCLEGGCRGDLVYCSNFNCSMRSKCYCDMYLGSMGTKVVLNTDRDVFLEKVTVCFGELPTTQKFFPSFDLDSYDLGPSSWEGRSKQKRLESQTLISGPKSHKKRQTGLSVTLTWTQPTVSIFSTQPGFTHVLFTKTNMNLNQVCDTPSTELTFTSDWFVTTESIFYRAYVNLTLVNSGSLAIDQLSLCAVPNCIFCNAFSTFFACSTPALKAFIVLWFIAFGIAAILIIIIIWLVIKGAMVGYSISLVMPRMNNVTNAAEMQGMLLMCLFGLAKASESDYLLQNDYSLNTFKDLLDLFEKAPMIVTLVTVIYWTCLIYCLIRMKSFLEKRIVKPKIVTEIVIDIKIVGCFLLFLNTYLYEHGFDITDGTVNKFGVTLLGCLAVIYLHYRLITKCSGPLHQDWEFRYPVWLAAYGIAVANNYGKYSNNELLIGLVVVSAIFSLVETSVEDERTFAEKYPQKKKLNKIAKDIKFCKKAITERKEEEIKRKQINNNKFDLFPNGVPRFSSVNNSTMILGLTLCLLCINVSACDYGVSIPSTHSTCIMGVNGQRTCSISDQILVSIAYPGLEACFDIINDRNEVLGRVIVTYVQALDVLTTNLEYYTSAFFFQTSSTKQCRISGWCQDPNGCSTPVNDITFDGSLTGISTLYPGLSQCLGTCGCAGCGCFFCASACMYCRWSLMPTAPVLTVYSPVTIKTQYTVDICYADSTGTTCVTKVLTSNVPIPVSRGTLTFLGSLAGSSTIFGTNKFIYNVNTGEMAYGPASQQGLPQAGGIGDVQGASYGSFSSPNPSSFIFDPTIGSASDGGSTCSFTQVVSGTTRVYSLLDKLPMNIGSTNWYSSGATIAGINSNPGALLMNIAFTNATFVSIQNQICPKMTSVDIKGCYLCPKGAVWHIVAYSSCLPGSCVLSVKGTNASLFTSSILLTTTPTAYPILFTMQGKTGIVTLTCSAGSNSEVISETYSLDDPVPVLLNGTLVGWAPGSPVDPHNSLSFGVSLDTGQWIGIIVGSACGVLVLIALGYAAIYLIVLNKGNYQKLPSENEEIDSENLDGISVEEEVVISEEEAF